MNKTSKKIRAKFCVHPIICKVFWAIINAQKRTILPSSSKENRTNPHSYGTTLHRFHSQELLKPACNIITCFAVIVFSIGLILNKKQSQYHPREFNIGRWKIPPFKYTLASGLFIVIFECSMRECEMEVRLTFKFLFISGEGGV